MLRLEPSGPLSLSLDLYAGRSRRRTVAEVKAALPPAMLRVLEGFSKPSLPPICDERGIPILDAIEVFLEAAVEKDLLLNLPSHNSTLGSVLCSAYDFIRLEVPLTKADLYSVLWSRKLMDGVILVESRSQIALASAFLRPQEHYECPSESIRGKAFLPSDYAEWFEKSSGVGFDYYVRWPAFNLPGKVVDALREGQLGPLLPQEESLIARIDEARVGKEELPYYVIGVVEGAATDLDHEVAHALFALDPRYKEETLRCLALLEPATFETLRAGLLSLGYPDDRDILRDEMQAYLSSSDELETVAGGEPTQNLLNVKSSLSRTLAAAWPGALNTTGGWKEPVGFHDVEVDPT